MQSLSVVLPALNEQCNLMSTLERAVRDLGSLRLHWEIIVVDDGSTDDTPSVCQTLADHYVDRIKIIRHDCNRGYGAALRSGFSTAKYELVFFTDSDGQFRFDGLQKFLLHIETCDMVIGFRELRRDPWFRKTNSRIGNLLARAMLGVKVRDINCAYKLFRKSLLSTLPLRSEGALINTEILAFAARRGWKHIEVPVSHYPRRFGNPTGANFWVILKTFKEYFILRKRMNQIKAE